MEYLLRLGLLFLGLVHTAFAQNCPSEATLQQTYGAGKVFSSENNDGCYVVRVDQKLTWLSAYQQCKQMALNSGFPESSGILATPKKESQQVALRDFMMTLKDYTKNGAKISEGFDYERYFVGGRLVSDVEKVQNNGFSADVSYPIWRYNSRFTTSLDWSEKQTVIQGCFWQRNFTGQDGRFQVTSLYANQTTPQACEQKCQNYPHFALHQEGSQSKCFCLYTFAMDPDGDGRFGYITGSNGIIYENDFRCNKQCSGNMTQYCGGTNRDFSTGNRYAETLGVTGGVFIEWDRDQPNYYERNQFCGVIDARDQSNGFRYQDEYCKAPGSRGDKSYGHFCEYSHLSNGDCPQASVDFAGSCIEVDTTKRNYFDSKAACRAKGGDLAYIPNRAVWGAMVTALKSNQNLLDQKYYIGLVGKEWLWMTSQPKILEEFSYVNFAKESPMGNGADCLNLYENQASGSTADRYVWEDSKCDATRFYICQIDIENDCVGNQCKNNAVCIDETNSYRCDCSGTGFTGQYCDIDIVDCVAGSCRNGAQCIEGVNSFTCQCAAGYTGQQCETNINECLPTNPCQNGATCQDAVNDVTCSCLSGYDGNRCQNDINECASAPCLNGGACTHGIGFFTCDCLPGFSGDKCQTNNDDCPPAVCQNGGSCVDGVNDYSCDCAPGWTGRTCEVAIPIATTTTTTNAPTTTATTTATTATTTTATTTSTTQSTTATTLETTNANNANSVEVTKTTVSSDAATTTTTTAATANTADTADPNVGTTTTAAPTTTTTTPTTTTTRAATTTRSTAASAATTTTTVSPPGVGASTSDSSLGTFEIALIVILSILLLSIIVAVIVFCYFKKRDGGRRGQVGVYDARSDAKVPSSGMIGDDIYIPPSETGSSAGLLADPSVFHTTVPFNGTRDQYVYNGKTPRISVEP